MGSSFREQAAIALDYGKPLSREWWKETAERFTGWIPDIQARANAVAFAADYCASESAAGRATSILHAYAVYNASTRCYCASCEREAGVRR